MKTIRFTPLPVLAFFLLAACTAQVPPSVDEVIDDFIDASSSAMMQDDGPFLEEEESSEESVQLDVNPGASSAAPSAQTRTVVVSVTTWSFSPSTITAKKGESVQLQLVGGEGIHSFAVPELGLNVRVEAGQTVTVALPTDTVGTFGASCRIPCGEGHKDMHATVIITE